MIHYKISSSKLANWFIVGSFIIIVDKRLVYAG